MISLERLLKLTNLPALRIGKILQGLLIRLENSFTEWFYALIFPGTQFNNSLILRVSCKIASTCAPMHSLVTPYIYFSVKVNQYQKRNHIPLRRKVSGLDLILSGKKPKMRFVITGGGPKVRAKSLRKRNDSRAGECLEFKKLGHFQDRVGSKMP